MTRLLARYIASHLLRGWLTTGAVIASIFWLIGLIQEVDSIRADYGFMDVLAYTVMVLPQQLLTLTPVVLMLGTILGLSGMERHRELTVISAAGVSRWTLLSALAMPTLLVMAILWIGMEFVTAQLHQRAEELRLDLRSENPQRLPRGGLWSKNGYRYIHLGSMRADNQPGDIQLYEFAEDGRLIRALHAASAVVEERRSWRFLDVQEKQLVGDVLETRRLPELVIHNLWAADELPVLTLSRNSMRLSLLLSYGDYLAANGRDDAVYRSTFWQRLAIPATTAAMVLLAAALSASRGTARGGSVGLMLAFGALLGILFYVGAQILYALGQILNMSLPLVAMLPALIVFVIAAALFSRLRW